MVSGKNLATVLTAILLTACAASSAPQTRGDTFTETYTDPALGESKRLSVFVARPRQCRAAHGETVLIVMHGLLRQGKKTRDDWVSLAQRHCLTVLVPEFDAQRFPTQLYQSGGVDQTANRGCSMRSMRGSSCRPKTTCCMATPPERSSLTGLFCLAPCPKHV
jgi:ABC-type uncharacterized transport system auxiliary subunit